MHSAPFGQGYQRANLVSAEELALIKRVDRQPRSKIDSILVTEAPAYATLYLRLLKKLVRVDTMQYILVMIGDALLGKYSRTSELLDVCQLSLYGFQSRP